VKGHKQQFLVCSLKGSKEFSLWKQSDAQMKRNLHFDLRLVWVFCQGRGVLKAYVQDTGGPSNFCLCSLLSTIVALMLACRGASWNELKLTLTRLLPLEWVLLAFVLGLHLEC
jgi:hypothetical protein